MTSRGRELQSAAASLLVSRLSPDNPLRISKVRRQIFWNEELL
jgi:hypothetical protein